MGSTRQDGPYPHEAGEQAKQLARVADTLSRGASDRGHFAVAAKWSAVAIFLRDIASGQGTYVRQETLFGPNDVAADETVHVAR